MPKLKDKQSSQSITSQLKEDLDKEPALHEVLHAALLLLVEHDLDRLRCEMVAAKLNLSIGKTLRLKKRFPDQSALVKALFYQIALNFKSAHQPQILPLKESLFEGSMDYFDMLSANKTAYGKLLKAELSAPKHALLVSNHFFEIARHILKKTPDSWQKSLILAGFPVLFRVAITAWREDETLDQSKTMAALDQGLEKIFSIVSLNKFV